MSSKTDPTTKKFGKGERTVPHHSKKAQKWYPAEDEAKPKKVREDVREGRAPGRRCFWPVPAWKDSVYALDQVCELHL